MIMKKPNRKQPQSIACPADCERLHNLSQTAYLLSVSWYTVNAEIKDGRLHAIKVRGRRFVMHDEIRAYMKRNRV
jgi:predicted site-specific integrase-resolvase